MQLRHSMRRLHLYACRCFLTSPRSPSPRAYYPPTTPIGVLTNISNILANESHPCSSSDFESISTSLGLNSYMTILLAQLPWPSAILFYSRPHSWSDFEHASRCSSSRLSRSKALPTACPPTWCPSTSRPQSTRARGPLLLYGPFQCESSRNLALEPPILNDFFQALMLVLNHAISRPNICLTQCW